MFRMRDFSLCIDRLSSALRNATWSSCRCAGSLAGSDSIPWSLTSDGLLEPNGLDPLSLSSSCLCCCIRFIWPSYWSLIPFSSCSCRSIIACCSWNLDLPLSASRSRSLSSPAIFSICSSAEASLRDKAVALDSMAAASSSRALQDNSVSAALDSSSPSLASSSDTFAWKVLAAAMAADASLEASSRAAVSASSSRRALSASALASPSRVHVTSTSPSRALILRSSPSAASCLCLSSASMAATFLCRALPASLYFLLVATLASSFSWSLYSDCCIASCFLRCSLSYSSKPSLE